jgi:electron transfer flavoprotein alpha subunit
MSLGVHLRVERQLPYAARVNIAVLVKQVPQFETMSLGPDGRLMRDGLPLELNPYCRRAVSKGVELARQFGGRCTVFTLGPPSAEDVLREAVAWGADDGVLITDRAFAGSDTLATARALAAALDKEGPFDLILAGRNSVDADTGQVGPEVAQLLDLPFLAGVKRLDVDPAGRRAGALLEHDDGWAEAEVQLPALLSCAERLTEPAKVDPDGRAAVAADRIRRLSAADLGDGPWGQAGSPTRVGEVRMLEAERQRLILEGPVEDQVATAVDLLADTGALAAEGQPDDVGAVPDGWSRGERRIAVLVEPDRGRLARELLGAAARLAAEIGGRVVAIGLEGGLEPEAAAAWGADEVVLLDGPGVEEDIARAVGGWAAAEPPWAVIAPGTMWGREVASRLGADLQAGLTGDAVGVAIEDDRLVGWKPAFGGRLVAAITAISEVQMVTVRPGVLPVPTPRAVRQPPIRHWPVVGRGRVTVLAAGRDDELDDLAAARNVVGVGAGVAPDEYEDLRPLLDLLGAQLAASRKVTDRAWLPRDRQVGITGRSISPSLYIAIGVAGKFNHMVGVRGAGKILAINPDRQAAVFESADIGVVADWRQAVPLLVQALQERRLHQVVTGAEAAEH